MADDIVRYSIKMPRDVAQAVQARAGKGDPSAYVVAAVRRQLERDNLRELIEAAEDEHGPITEEEMRRKLEQLARAERGTFGTGGE
ncbi:CopG family transcriptional regulator [Pseudofrankia asymbiotica]|uniref:CopG family transcriptional regulator n=1 Tax=Pseudofrankia asymbiotica TaxID=1834516 RepID=A0A1V2I0W8_9ACTN|nr:CopG family transcriptional regulator [Pseudofrankia asymbiotica]ONH23247.1 CopG family transcriptional regulator [Pseudofrankia asymbiotica]